MKKDWTYSYYGYRPVPDYVVRVKIPRGKGTLDAYDAEVWNYVDKKWLPSESALEDVRYDPVNTTSFTKQDVMEMIGDDLK